MKEKRSEVTEELGTLESGTHFGQSCMAGVPLQGLQDDSSQQALTECLFTELVQSIQLHMFSDHTQAAGTAFDNFACFFRFKQEM